MELEPRRKPVFNFKIPFYQRFWNRLTIPLRGYVFFVAGLGIYFFPGIRKGLKINKFYEERDTWIKENVRDPHNLGFAHIDNTEPPPKPLPN